MAEDKLMKDHLAWLSDNDCFLSELDGKPFVIVLGHIVTKDPEFKEAMVALLEDGDLAHETLFWYTYYGYTDDYGWCHNCGRGFELRPARPGQALAYWENLEHGEVYCGDCTSRYFADDYIRYLTQACEEGRAVLCNFVKPENYGFTLAIVELKGEIYAAQPRYSERLAAYTARKTPYHCLFTGEVGLVDAVFDVYLRRRDGGPVSRDEAEAYRDTVSYTDRVGRRLRSRIRDE